MVDKILVLGGGGFIGKSLLSSLQRLSMPVVVLGRGLSDGKSRHIERRRGSIEDASLLRELLADCSAVAYLASVSTPSASAREPGLEVTGNLLPLARFLEVAQVVEPRKLIYLSSAGAVYGDCVDNVTEGALLRPRSFYGAGKVAAEALLHAFSTSTNWQTAVVRPSNVYGPGQLPTKGFAIVPTIFQHMLEQQKFQIWGDGSVVRDYLFVDDLVDLIVRCACASMPRFSVYNAASGTAVSVLDLVRLCEQVAARALQIQFHPSRSVDVKRVVPSAAAAADAFDWKAATGIAEGLQDTWNWLRSTLPAN